MFLSRTMTAPTCLRSQVARVATSRAICMKYWSQVARSRGLMARAANLHSLVLLDHVRLPWLGPRVKRKLLWLGSVGWIVVLGWGGSLAFGEPPSDRAVAEQIL